MHAKSTGKVSRMQRLFLLNYLEDDHAGLPYNALPPQHWRLLTQGYVGPRSA